MKRREFLDTCRRLLTTMEFDHEEHTGIDEDHEMPFKDWLGEIAAVEENTHGET